MIPSQGRALRLVDKSWLKVQLQFEPRDIWIGLFWRRTEIAWHFYICILPLLPLHISILAISEREE